jgi:hypothetical protein
LLSDDLFNLAKLRILVGYLGEADQFSWWPSSFLSSVSQTFLMPVFPKTWRLAQYHSVTEAATRVHDDQIGIGQGVFHLFRLPEHIEKELFSSAMIELLAKEIDILTASKDVALEALKKLVNSKLDKKVGPVRLNYPNSLSSDSIWQTVACYYWLAFGSGDTVFPYFSEQR